MLDTHLLLWIATRRRKLSPEALDLIGDPDNELVFSVANIWEISVKSTLNRPDFNVDPRMLRRGLLDNGYSELLINSEHAFGVKLLPRIHKDPFDRILIAQATYEGFLFLTEDKEVAEYPGPIQKV
jgi:PIN domain nuclease of toxin-antitoxin system